MNEDIRQNLSVRLRYNGITHIHQNFPLESFRNYIRSENLLDDEIINTAQLFVDSYVDLHQPMLLIQFLEICKFDAHATLHHDVASWAERSVKIYGNGFFI